MPNLFLVAQLLLGLKAKVRTLPLPTTNLKKKKKINNKKLNAKGVRLIVLVL